MEGRKYPDKETILALLKTGTVLTVAMLSPNALILFKNKPLFSPWEKFHQPLLRRNIRNLKRKGLVDFSERDDETIVKITESGKTEILKFDIEKIKIKRPKVWDGFWRVIVFDIPNKKKRAREVLRAKLKELEFYQLQESVFVNPFPCEDEIRFLREVFEVPHDVKIILAKTLDNEEELRKMYGL